jgi:uncharacterized protein (DUF305 family)
MKLNLHMLALASTLALMPVAAAQMMGDSSMGMKSMQTLEKLEGQPFDIAYMSQMIEHHTGAIEMAHACVTNCKRTEVKKAAQTIITDQEREIKQLTDWLKTWYDVAPDKAQMAMMRTDNKGMMDKAMGGMKPMAGMARNPDKAFLEGMIPHHQGAIDMSKLALTKAARPELKVFAQSVITAQSSEITQFTAWLKTLK